MSLPLVLGAIWVIASAIVAMLPLRAQMEPGVALSMVAPVLLVRLVPGLCAFVSMFRNPWRYVARRALGRPAPFPREPGK